MWEKRGTLGLEWPQGECSLGSWEQDLGGPRGSQKTHTPVFREVPGSGVIVLILSIPGGYAAERSEWKEGGSTPAPLAVSSPLTLDSPYFPH